MVRVQSSWQDLNEKEAGLAAWKQEHREHTLKDVRAHQIKLDQQVLHLQELQLQLSQQKAAQQVTVWVCVWLVDVQAAELNICAACVCTGNGHYTLCRHAEAYAHSLCELSKQDLPSQRRILILQQCALHPL